jgi:cobalt/nickel transport system permease protein
VEAKLSGVLQIPLMDFWVIMVGVHLLIGFIEGLITFSVLAYMRRVQPECLGEIAISDLAPACQTAHHRPGKLALLASLLITAIVLAGLISSFASTRPDGLEWVLGRDPSVPAIKNESQSVAAATALQERTAPLPEYSHRPAHGGEAPNLQQELQETAWPNFDRWGSLAGVVGTVVTLGLVYLLAFVLRRKQRAAA